MLNIFNDLKIIDTNGTVTKEKGIPCTFTPKEKLYYVLREAENNKRLDTSLPRMALYLSSIDVALNRAYNSYTKRRFILSKQAFHPLASANAPTIPLGGISGEPP